MKRRADSLPTKTVNQYRSRDIFAYLALRYCSANELARSNKWVEDNAIQVVLASKQGAYLRSYHFKQVDEVGAVRYREIFVPGVTEALAEAALLSECAKRAGTNFGAHVFSYRLTTKEDRRACFEPYMVGLRERQSEIASYCRRIQGGIVAYIDIEQFYPSITIQAAAVCWSNFCAKYSMPELYADLGKKLIENYRARSNGASILTGPMFSHFLANLILDPLDRLSTELPATYLRYVDDITLVGLETDVKESLERVRSNLASMGFKVHSAASPKTMIVPTSEWVESASDFDQGPNSIEWMKLVGNIKKLILFDRTKSAELENAFQAEGFRLPIPDYTRAVDEASSFERVRRLGLWNWLRIKSRKISVETVVADAKLLSARLVTETSRMLKEHGETSQFQRKRTVSKLRYRLGRLTYIGMDEDLERISREIRNWPELKFHSAIIDALISRDFFEVVTMGSNVAQAAAQAFRPSLQTAWFSAPLKTEPQLQGLAVLILNGVPVEGEVRSLDHPLLRFARGPIDADLMSQPRGLVQELACLHGLGEVRHSIILRYAFDIDEHIVLDALELDYGYYS